ncbi:MAG: acyl-CoA/acyl-ACP dehydrogenase [Solirubrobacterales bacterium]|nr:acyl-CoA/acyl-ACP dehydrogenase [Solirubrobacterales bacterium]MCB8970921.1 acyl-CoA/acyl-ACP dehydrogenase [Thermoleophilales bacterium]MCO5326183.1 acyl-CoA/acyl-ACP dehydrogenase [Solirubrobacterales bacterium]
MNFELTDEQEMLREAAIDALGRHPSLAAAREAADGAERLDLWPVAVEAGWCGLLVSEERGGAGLGLFDAMLVLEQCGRTLASTGLVGHLAGTLVLERAAERGDDDAADAAARAASGEARVATLFAAPPLGEGAWTIAGADPAAGPKQVPIRDSGAISGEAGFVPDAPGSDLLVVPALGEGDELGAYLVDADDPGVAIDAFTRFDHTRPLAHVRLGGASSISLDATAADLADAWNFAQAMLAAEAIGVSDAVREMAVEYSRDRHAFGRPIGSYQAVKHQLVEMLRAAATARSLTYYAGLSADGGGEDLGRAAGTLRFAAERASDFSTRTCIAVHGGIGVTWEHDAPLYLRRSQLSRLLLGGERGAADRVADEVIAAARRRRREQQEAGMASNATNGGTST